MGADLLHRYTKSDLSIFDREEKRRFLGRGDEDLQRNPDLAWELLYRLEPELYERLVRAERLHPGILEWLPQEPNRVVEIGAGAGRLTMQLVSRTESMVAVEPAAPLRRMLTAKLHQAGHGQRVRVLRGFFDAVPLPEACATSSSRALPSRRRRRTAARRDFARWSGCVPPAGSSSSCGPTTSPGSRAAATPTEASRDTSSSSSQAWRRRWRSVPSSIRRLSPSCAGGVRGECPTTSWASTLLAMSRTRGNRLEDCPRRAPGDKDRRASAWRFTGLRRGSGRWSCEQGAQRRCLCSFGVTDLRSQRRRHGGRPPDPPWRALPSRSNPRSARAARRRGCLCPALLDPEEPKLRRRPQPRLRRPSAQAGIG